MAKKQAEPRPAAGPISEPYKPTSIEHPARKGKGKGAAGAKKGASGKK